MDAAADIGRNPVSKHQPIRVRPSAENEQADAGRDGQILLARSHSRAWKGTGKYTLAMFR